MLWSDQYPDPREVKMNLHQFVKPGEECQQCDGWAGPEPIVLHAGVDPVGGRFCSARCAVEAIELAAADDAKFEAARAS